MADEVVFEQLGKKEALLLLRAFDYDIDGEEYILSPSGKRIPSEEFPSKHLKIEDAALIKGSLKVIDGTPLSISRFLRERLESGGCGGQ
ncbi:MAG: hypothetical protein V1822_00190 [Candidatus Micrarchaeota archaeon]